MGKQCQTLFWGAPKSLQMVTAAMKLKDRLLLGRKVMTNLTAAAAAAKSLQSCPTLCDPITAAHKAPPSLGFSRQEHWSGLPFPYPIHESEK